MAGLSLLAALAYVLFHLVSAGLDDGASIERIVAGVALILGLVVLAFDAGTEFERERSEPNGR